MSRECAVKGCQREPGGSWPLCSKHDGMKADLDFMQRSELDETMVALREAERERTARWEPDPDLVEAQKQHAALMATLCPCGHPYSDHNKIRSDGGPPFCSYSLSRRCGCNGLGLEAGRG